VSGGSVGVEQRRKLVIAVEQIEAAVERYESGAFVCAITLAGAGEEILARMVTNLAKEDHALKARIKGTRAIFHAADAAFPDVRDEMTTDKRIANAANRLRNELKHHDVGTDSSISFDFKDGAKDMLDRAIENYFLLMKDQTDIMKRYLTRRHAANS
jgi:hypothetical protein